LNARAGGHWRRGGRHDTTHLARIERDDATMAGGGMHVEGGHSGGCSATASARLCIFEIERKAVPAGTCSAENCGRHLSTNSAASWRTPPPQFVVRSNTG